MITPDQPLRRARSFSLTLRKTALRALVKTDQFYINPFSLSL